MQHSKTRNTRNTRNTILAAIAVLALGAPLAASADISSTALPSGASVQGGNPQIGTSGNTETINLNGQSAIVDWTGGFDIGSQATVQVNGGGSSGNIPSLLNIDTSGNPSEIAGTLNASEASVIIANGNGVTIDGSANLSVPNGNLMLVGGTVTNDSSFLSNGTFTVGDGNNDAPLNIDNGATIQAQNTLYAGAGVVNMGNANYGTPVGSSIFGGYGANGSQFVSMSNGRINYNYSLLQGPSSTPTTINIAAGANVPEVYSLLSQGNINIDGSVSALYIPGNNNFNGIIHVSGDNIEGSGSINANTVTFAVDGNINNPYGGGNSSNRWLPNHFTLNPLSPSQGGNGIVDLILSNFHGNAPQYLNILVNGEMEAQSVLDTVTATGGTPANANSHLILQSTGSMAILGTKDLYANTPEDNGSAVNGGLPEFSFPGMMVFIAGSNGQTPINVANDQQQLLVPAELDNYTGASIHGEGIFLEAGSITNGLGKSITAVLNPSYEWLNFAGNVGSPVTVYGITGPGVPGNFPSVTNGSPILANTIHYFQSW